MTQGNNGLANNKLFGEAGHTDSQGLETLCLIDVTEIADDAGFEWPVALSVAAWSDCVTWADAGHQRQAATDHSARLWDVLCMAAAAVRTTNITDHELQFDLRRMPCDGTATESQKLSLKLILGPDDVGEPVITIMQPRER